MANDAFDTIVRAIREGRGVYDVRSALADGVVYARVGARVCVTHSWISTPCARCVQNIRKILIFVMPTNFAQGLSIFFAIVIGMDFPLTPMQVLWVNMATSVTLGMVLALGTWSTAARGALWVCRVSLRRYELNAHFFLTHFNARAHIVQRNRSKG
ncbi:hypothetical protein EON66_08885 [archaeon]|nr:MAG: hypothetical protein EON66_08885 [archaeon]